MCTCLIARVRDAVHSTVRIRGCSGARTCECGVRRSLIALELTSGAPRAGPGLSDSRPRGLAAAMLSNSLSVHIFANAHTYIYSFSHITHFTHTCQHAARAPDSRLRLSSHRRRPRIPWPACGRPPAAPAWPLCPTTQPKSAQPAHTRSQRHARWGILPPCAAVSYTHLTLPTTD